MRTVANVVIAIPVHVSGVSQVKYTVNARWDDPKYPIPGIHKDVAKNHRGYSP